MHKRIRHALGGLLMVASLAATPAFPDVVKCVDAQGKASYTDQACPPGTTSQSRTITQGAGNAPSQTSSTSSSSSSSSSSSDSERQRDAAFNEYLAKLREGAEARRRDAQARCDQGDREGCADAVCSRTNGDGAQPSDYLACARASGYESGKNWVQTDKVSDNKIGGGGSRRVSITCLTPGKGYNAVRLQADPDATRWHGAGRFFWNSMGGPDFATWQEAASAACAQ